MIGLFLAGAALTVKADVRPEMDFGPFASRWTDIHGVERFQLLGPVVEAGVSEHGDGFLALRPLFSRVEDSATERTRMDIAWPLCVAKTFREESYCRFLTVFYLDYDRKDPESRYHFRAFPFYFQGRDKFGADYIALFPFGGQINEFLGRDYINFLLFPLWTRHSINSVDTRSVLWPLISHTSGKGVHRFRVFPLYGQSMDQGRFSKKFVLWPFWTSGEYLHPRSYGSGYVVFPLFGHLALSDEETWFVVPPLFRFSRGDRLETVHAPWPLLQYKSGEEERLYVFPLWGRKSQPGNYTQFTLWPIVHRQRLDRGETVLHRFWLRPFWYADRYMAPAGPGSRSSAGEVQDFYYKLWPLASYRRDGDVTRFRLLELWPFKNAPVMDRNFAPFWTLYSRQSIDQDVDHEFLWGLVRDRVREGEGRYTSVFPFFDWTRTKQPSKASEFRILKGLFGWKREGAAKQIQLLYLLRFGNLENGGLSNEKGSTASQAEPSTP